MEQRKLKRNNVVRVYEDPMTRTREEGLGRLIRKQNDLHDGYERWLVDFDDGYGALSRTVHPADFVAD